MDKNNIMGAVSSLPDDYDIEKDYTTQHVDPVEGIKSIYDFKRSKRKPGVKISNATAGMIGDGVDTAMKIAGGIATGVSTKRARERAEAQSMQEIAKARFQRQQDADDQAEQDKFDKQQAQFANMKANTGLRLNMFARDLQKQAQKFQDGRNAIAKFRQKEAINNNFRSQLTGAVGGQ